MRFRIGTTKTAGSCSDGWSKESYGVGQVECGTTQSGAWRVLEFGAEASVDPGDDWRAVQVELHDKLDAQIWAEWSGEQRALRNGEQRDPS